MLNTRGSMREGTNEQMYTATKHITTVLLRSREKILRILSYWENYPYEGIRQRSKLRGTLALGKMGNAE